jgi:hypothetical protein
MQIIHATNSNRAAKAPRRQQFVAQEGKTLQDF